MCGWESKSGWVLYGVSSEAVEKMLEVATEFFSLPVAEELKLYTRMTHQRQWDFLQVLMRTRKRFTIGGTILDFNVVLWTNMCLSGLPIPLISSKYFFFSLSLSQLIFPLLFVFLPYMDTKVLSTGVRYTNLPENYIRPESDRLRLS